jgi:hypothetical protein
VGAQLVADHAGAGFVIFSGGIDRGDPDQASRKIHDLIGGAIDFGDHSIN